MTIKQALAKHSLILLGGGEPSLRRKALDTIFQELGIDPKDYDVMRLEGNSPPANWYLEATTLPFLSEKRIVIIRHLLQGDIKAADTLKWNVLPETSLVVFVVDDEGGDYDKQRQSEAKAKAWAKLVQTNNGFVEEFKVSKEKVRSLLQHEYETHGKKITPKALDALLEMVGDNLSLAMEETEKLVLFAGGDKEIREADVRLLVVPSKEWNVFNMVDEMVAGNRGNALAQMKVLTSGSTKIEDAAFRSILPNLSKRINLLWQARICVEEKITPTQIPDRLRSLFPVKPQLSSEGYRVGKLIDSAKRTSFEQLTACFRSLELADARLKGLETGFSGQETLERLVLEMCEHFQNKPAFRP